MITARWSRPGGDGKGRYQLSDGRESRRSGWQLGNRGRLLVTVVGLAAAETGTVVEVPARTEEAQWH